MDRDAPVATGVLEGQAIPFILNNADDPRLALPVLTIQIDFLHHVLWAKLAYLVKSCAGVERQQWEPIGRLACATVRSFVLGVDR
ncbi:hypothetical protein D3C73_1413480 [compost metagenome]